MMCQAAERQVTGVKGKAKEFQSFGNDILILVDQASSSIELTVRYLEWDTDFFGKKIGLLKAKYNNPSQAALKQALNTLQEEAEKKEYDCLYARIPANETDILNAFVKQGFLIRDTLITLIRDLRNGDIPSNTQNHYVIRPFVKRDADVLYSISINEYNHSRFFNDPEFCSKAPKMYAEWAKNDAEGDYAEVFVVEKNGEVAGYISCTCDYETRTGIINLVAVKKEYQSQGIGKALLCHFMNVFRSKGMECVQAGTHLSNLDAVNYYIRSGFRIRNSEYSLHKWLRREEQ